jgi:signal transduction histidine kinase/ABC-type amino acid transport substrate-binding protein
MAWNLPQRLARWLLLPLGVCLLLNAQPPRRLVVVSSVNNPPYEYLDAQGQPQGYVNDLIRAVAVAQGLELEIRSMPFSELKGAFDRREAEVATGMVFSEERAKSMDFSVPHSYVPYVLITRKGEGHIRSERDCIGKDVLVLGKSIMAEHLASLGIHFRETATHEASIRSLASGIGDAAIVPRFTFLFFAKNQNIKNLQSVPSEIFPTKRCFAVHKGEERLLAALNEGLFRLKQDGSLDRIYARHLGALEESELPFTMILRRALWILGPVILGLGLLGLVSWSFSLKHRVRVRTFELDQRNRELSARNRELETLDQMVTVINREMNLQPLMEKLIAGCLAQFPKIEAGTLFLKNETDGRFHTRLHLGAPEPGVEQGSFTEEALLVLCTEDIEHLGRGVFRKAGTVAGSHLERHGSLPIPKAMLAMSLVFEETIQGYLLLSNYSDADAFDDADVHTLARFREHAIAALVKALTLDRLHASLSQLQRVNELKSQFLGIVAHDLRNPLSAIVLSAQLLEGERDHGEITSIAQNIFREGLEMSDLVGRFLDIAKIDSGEVKAEPEIFDIAALVQNVARRHHARGKQKGITFNFRFPASGALVLADPKFVKEALDNLLSNAVKFSPPGSTVTLRLETEADRIVTSVEDQGPGLTPQDKEVLFGRFARLSAKPTGGEKSIGLGLSIVKHMVDATGGRIWVDSEPGQGAAFRVELPAPPATGLGLSPAPAPRSGP